MVTFNNLATVTYISRTRFWRETILVFYYIAYPKFVNIPVIAKRAIIQYFISYNIHMSLRDRFRDVFGGHGDRYH